MNLKTPFEEIVDVTAIGESKNTRSLNELLQKAGEEKLQPARNDAEQVLLLAIDMQNDFLENGSLAVPGSHGDIERLTKFIYNNMNKISRIAVSIDTHIPHQIFHPCWWIDEQGNNAPPFTPITLQDLDNGKWKPVIEPIKSREYVEGLKKTGNKDLFIWPYHCIQGTYGCALENQFTNMIYFHEVAKKSIPLRIVKGYDPLSEMYGIFKPEFDRKNYVNIDALNMFEKFDKVIFGGEAETHCVFESIRQLLDHYTNKKEVTKKFFVLEDCMSPVPGFDVKAELENFKKQYKINIVKSTDLIL